MMWRSFSTPSQCAVAISPLRLPEHFTFFRRVSKRWPTSCALSALNSRTTSSRRRRVLPRETLIDRVWGADYVGDTKTLDEMTAAAAYLEELSAALGDRLTVHASDEHARIDLDSTFRALPHGAIAIMCGPMRMLEAARRAWNDAGRAPADLRYETFGSSGLKPTAGIKAAGGRGSRAPARR